MSEEFGQPEAGMKLIMPTSSRAFWKIGGLILCNTGDYIV